MHGRLFAYGNTWRYRLYVNHKLTLINQAKCKINEYCRDGAIRINRNCGCALAYNLNRCGCWCLQSKAPLDLASAMRCYDFKDYPMNDCFCIGDDLLHILTEGKKQLLIGNTVSISYQYCSPLSFCRSLVRQVHKRDARHCLGEESIC